MCDGTWMPNPNADYHNHIYRLIGDAKNFNREDILSYPDFSGPEGSWFGYGIISVDGIIYSAVSKTPGTRWSGPFRGVKLLKSKDNTKTWIRIAKNGSEKQFDGAKDSTRNLVNENEMFFLEEGGIAHIKQIAYPFTSFDFVQNGKDNLAAKDNYIYIYSPEGAFSYKLLLARVIKDKFGNKKEWEYFVKYNENNQPKWIKDIDKRGYVHEYPKKSKKGDYFGWYSWLPSVVWNEGLGLYIMVNGGTYAGHKMTNKDEDYYDSWMHTKTGSLGFWYAEKPYGPWKQFYYNEYWIVDDEKNRTYQPKLSPKWISEDGLKMILIWSDAMENKNGESHTVNYLWNQMEISIELLR